MLNTIKNALLTPATCLVLAFSANSMAAADAGQVKLELQQKLANVAGFQADFTQQVIDADGNSIQQSSGDLAVKRPNFLYWQTLAPDETLVVSDGKTLWFYNPFVEQVSAYSIDNAVANTPILLLTGLNEQAWQDYRVEKLNEQQYQIFSIEDNAQVTSLELSFEQGVISTFTVTDATGQLSQFRLNNIVTSPMPDDALFSFSLPDDVDLDDQR